MKLTANWVEALAFDATSDNGHTVRLDTTVDGGGLDSGMSPKKLVLAGLCGCSGMDVVDILKKMKVDLKKLEVSAEAEQTDEHPKTFKYINLVYRAAIPAEDLDKLQRAVSLSMDKYCGVSAMLAKHCPINHSVELI
ncbi:MAG: osmotically inducible protein C [Chitinophagaceae bacterium BSSC1]|nr:MAG: osmotically inducible protein C [Chitinophagaceae bacterium BSSC1]